MPRQDLLPLATQAHGQTHFLTRLGDAITAPGDGVRPRLLTPTELVFLRQALACQRRRWHAFQAGPLRVLVDGDA